MTRGPLAAATIALALCSACASVRARHARDVGTAGAQWAKATDAVLVLAEETTADADSARVLSEARGLPKDSRREVLEKHASISAVVADLERLRRHARLLGRYFERLHDLSDDAEDTSVQKATASAADAAVSLGKELTDSKLLTASERDAIARSAGLAVRAGREAALSRELERRGDLVARELLLQQTVLEAVRRQVRADSATLAELGLARDVVRPYVDDTVSDPRAWIALRRTYVLPAEPSEALAAASTAASGLRTAWTALAEGHFDAAAWAAVSADAEALASYVALIQEARRR